MWGFHKSEDRRNSASVVELRRAAKLALLHQSDLQKSPGLRRASSWKERDGQIVWQPTHIRPPHPTCFDSDFKTIDQRTGSDGEIKISTLKHKNYISKHLPINIIQNYEQREYSSLNYQDYNDVLSQERAVKDLRSVDSCPAIHGSHDEDSGRRSRTNSYSSSRHVSLTDIPEDIKASSTTKGRETTALFTTNDTCSIWSYHSCDYFFKVMLVGDSGVGKTCLITKFRDDIFLAGSFIPTVGIDSKSKTLSVEGKKVHMQIWDTAGQTRFRTLLRTYCRTAQAVVLQYDVRNRLSFINIREWKNVVRESSREAVLLLLVGNKSDLQEKDRAVSREEGEALGQQLNIPYIETSAKTGSNVNLLFTVIAKQLMSMKSEDDNGFDMREYVKQHDASIAGFCSICRIC